MATKFMDYLRASIETLIRQELSPPQVVDYLSRQRGVSLHHETVHQFVYADKACDGGLYTHLRVNALPKTLWSL